MSPSGRSSLNVMRSTAAPSSVRLPVRRSWRGLVSYCGAEHRGDRGVGGPRRTQLPFDARLGFGVVGIAREDALARGKRLAMLAALARHARITKIERRIGRIAQDLLEDRAHVAVGRRLRMGRARARANYQRGGKQSSP